MGIAFMSMFWKDLNQRNIYNILFWRDEYEIS